MVACYCVIQEETRCSLSPGPNSAPVNLGLITVGLYTCWAPVTQGVSAGKSDLQATSVDANVAVTCTVRTPGGRHSLQRRAAVRWSR